MLTDSYSICEISEKKAHKVMKVRHIEMIEVICNDRVGKKVRVKCNEDDTIGDLKKLIAAQVGTRPEKIRYVKLVSCTCVPTRKGPTNNLHLLFFQNSKVVHDI